MTRSKKVVKDASEGKFVPRALPIEHHIPDTLPSHYVSNVVTQLTDENHFKIMFFDVRPPIRVDGSGFTEKDVAKAVCVASLVVTPEKLGTWVELFSRQLKSLSSLPKKDTKEQPDK